MLVEPRREDPLVHLERLAAELTKREFRAPGTPPIRLWLCSDRQCVLVQVWDGNHQMPHRKALELEAEHGRGLLLVEALSTEWGAYMPEGSDGKIVWAVLGR